MGYVCVMPYSVVVYVHVLVRECVYYKLRITMHRATQRQFEHKVKCQQHTIRGMSNDEKREPYGDGLYTVRSTI